MSRKVPSPSARPALRGVPIHDGNLCHNNKTGDLNENREPTPECLALHKLELVLELYSQRSTYRVLQIKNVHRARAGPSRDSQCAILEYQARLGFRARERALLVPNANLYSQTRIGFILVKALHALVTRIVPPEE